MKIKKLEIAKLKNTILNTIEQTWTILNGTVLILILNLEQPWTIMKLVEQIWTSQFATLNIIGQQWTILKHFERTMS